MIKLKDNSDFIQMQLELSSYIISSELTANFLHVQSEILIISGEETDGILLQKLPTD